MTKIEEYTQKFLEEAESPTEEEGREETLNELSDFIDTMRGRPLASVSLDEEQSAQWDDTKGDFDYQDYYGREVISQISEDGETEAVVIHNAIGLPLAMAAKHPNGGWGGIGVDSRLREIVVGMLEEKLG